MAESDDETRTTLVLTRKAVETVATMSLAVSAVERAFAAFGRGEATMPPKVYLPIPDRDGDFRAMPARLGGAAGIKWVNVHPANRSRGSFPTVMGTYILNDPATGFPKAIMDGTLLTALRTGAAGAVASKYLASGSPKSIAFIGAGAQAYTLYDAHRVVFSGFDSLVHDQNADAAGAFVDRVGGKAVDLEEAASADIVCTATPSRTPFLDASWIRPGAHVNAMGADAPGKQELDPALLKSASVYIDDIHQATSSGEINVPLREGAFRVEDLAGTLGEVVAGVIEPPARGITTVFDSTGLAIQDVALAQAIFEAAVAAGLGSRLDLIGIE